MRQELRRRSLRSVWTGALFQLTLLVAACGDTTPMGSGTNQAGGSAGDGGSNAGTGGSSAGVVGTGGGSAGSASGGTGPGDGSATGGGPPAGGAAGSAGTGGARDAAPPTNEATGWAAVPALGQNGTYGGVQGETVDVTTISSFLAAAAGATARVIRLQASVSGDVIVGSNKTIEGVGGAVFQGNLRIDSAQNVIVRNLTVKGKNCTDNPMCSGGDDAIEVRGSHHVWFDHLDVSDGSDGNLDITQGSDYVTVSWSKFWYSGTSREHRFSNLIGSADNNPIDEGKLKVTWHHNWWADNADQRMPRTRYGLIHVVNNLYTSRNNSYCANAGFQASVLLENNVFRGVNSPHTVAQDGNLLSRGNVYDDVSGTRDETGTAFDPPYDYTPDAASGLEQRIMQEAGPR